MKKIKKPFILFLFLFIMVVFTGAKTILAAGERTKPYRAWDNHRFIFQEYSWEAPREVEVQLLGMYTGEDANYLIANENMFNTEPAYDEEWILMGFNLAYISGPEETLDASEVISSMKSFYTNTGQKITPIDTAVFSNILEGYSQYDVSLYPGGASEVWYGILVKKSVGFPLIRIGTGYDDSTYQTVYKWFSTDPSYYENILSPTNLTASSASLSSISISWSSVTGATGYEIYRSTSSTGNYSLISNISSTSFIDTGLTTGVVYYYKVRAYTFVGQAKVYSDFTGVANAKPVLTGWVKDSSGKWYYYKSDGSLSKGWLSISGQWYYFDTYGVMQSGWRLLGSKWYYFNTNGTMAKGWKLIGTKKYYFDTNGTMATGWKLIDGKWYYFDGSGVMAKDWKLISNKWYYFDINGVMKTGWLQQGTKWYYLNSSGAMVTGSILLGGRWYYFDNNGVWIK
jgi:glucan-binding YG repeat protein